MERISEPVLIGDLWEGFWNPNTKEEEVEKFKNDKNLYKDEEGILRCKVCNEPRIFLMEETGRWLPCACSCSEKKTEDENLPLIIQELKVNSGIEGRYRQADFDTCDITDDNERIYTSCLKYAMNFKVIAENGMGMYLHGDSGTGKTYFAACIGNFLLNTGIEVLFANVNNILSDIRYSYSQRGSEKQIINKYSYAELVIFDDIGTERYSTKNEAMSFAQDKFFQIIDKRYTQQKPTIFTSNYTLEQLIKERGILKKTVDRIDEMSTRKFELEGRPRRQVRRTTAEIKF